MKRIQSVLLKSIFCLVIVACSGCRVFYPSTEDYAGLPQTAQVLEYGSDLPATPRMVTVNARAGWQNTGIFLKKGEHAQFVATGSWDGGPLLSSCGPDGVSAIAIQVREDPRFPCMALIGRITTGRPFLVGHRCRIEARQDGYVLLSNNDVHTGLNDNHGSMNVTIRTSRAHGQSVSADLRIVRVSDGSVLASASDRSGMRRLSDLAKALSSRLRSDMPLRGESIAVLSLRNRSHTNKGLTVAEELADKVSGALLATSWFQVKERIDIRGIVDEKDLDSSGIVNNKNVRRRLSGVKYIVMGGVTVE